MGDLQPLALPDPLDPLVVDQPARLLQQPGDLAIAYVRPDRRASAMVSAASCSSSSWPRGGLRCVERCCASAVWSNSPDKRRFEASPVDRVARPQGAPWGRATRSTGEFSNGASGENYSGINTALGQHRSTQRKVPRGREDEERLTADTIALARQYGR